MSNTTIKLDSGAEIDARIDEETVITYGASARVNGRNFSTTYDFEDEEEALDDLKAQILEAFPELNASTPEAAEEIHAATPLWMRKGMKGAEALARWQKGEPFPAPVSPAKWSAPA